MVKISFVLIADHVEPDDIGRADIIGVSNGIVTFGQQTVLADFVLLVRFDSQSVDAGVPQKYEINIYDPKGDLCDWEHSEFVPSRDSRFIRKDGSFFDQMATPFPQIPRVEDGEYSIKIKLNGQEIWDEPFWVAVFDESMVRPG